MSLKKKDTHKNQPDIELSTDSFMNTKTGEIVTASTFTMRSVDFNFEKIWLFHLADAYGLIGGKSIEILNFLLKNRNSENLTICTQRGIANSLNISLDTVTRVMTKLKDKDVISIHQQGVYRINPDMIFKGSSDKRMRILFEYRKEKENEKNNENNILKEEAEILSEINSMTKNIEKLSKRLNALRDKRYLEEESAAE